MEVNNMNLFKLENCIVDIEEDFFGVIEEILEEYGYWEIDEILSILNNEKDKRRNEVYNLFSSAVYDAIESSVYHTLKNIITHHTDKYFEHKNYSDEQLSMLEHISEEIDNMHLYSPELQAVESKFKYCVSSNDSDNATLYITLSKIAGVCKEIKIDTIIFKEESSGKNIIQEQLNKFVVEIIRESPYNLMKKLMIEG